ncbi:MAG: membrane protein insertion efficiency factor YidD [Bacteroidales bacterium]|nr:MAG: membrane protein insertion efficiency factor YidD [Bacteroidales bacterium]
MKILSFLKRLLTIVFIIPIKIYQYTLSPLMPASCRHLPTCSQYAIEALKIHGILKGGWLTFRRVIRCHPWGTHGFDPVPPKKAKVRKVSLSQK